MNEPPSYLSQEKSQIQKDLWRIEDVIAGLSANKENFRILVESVKNPGEWATFLGAGSWRSAPIYMGWPLGRSGLYGVSPPGKRVFVPSHPLFLSMTLREKNGAFVSSPACAFTLDS